MEKNIESIRFNLTSSMALELIKFNKLKEELNDLKMLYSDRKENNILSKINKIEKQMNICKNNFIRQFRNNNYEEIKNYLMLKDQKK